MVYSPRVEIFVNGKSVPYRSFNEEEQAKVDEAQIRAERLYNSRKSEGLSIKGINLNTFRQKHVVLLVSPQPGDDVTYSELPGDVEQIWVRWQDPLRGKFNMPLT